MQNPKNILAEEGLPEVNRLVALNMRRFGPYIDREEIYSAALNGLAQAIERFNPELNIPIAVYARARIQGAIFDRITTGTLLSRRLFRNATLYRRLRAEAEFDDDESEQTDEYLSELAAQYCVIRHWDIEENQCDRLLPDEQLIRKEDLALLAESIKALSPEESRIIVRVFFEDVTLRKIARERGCTTSWVSKRLRRALALLRKQFEERSGLLAPSNKGGGALRNVTPQRGTPPNDTPQRGTSSNDTPPNDTPPSDASQNDALQDAGPKEGASQSDLIEQL
ncbi:MAG: sigma-70 family RNA polymerase sigma factor [Proteobacteria bacterium]|nr:sigma-70 family RNA polymerase sigma factor [Pseudomonadota bacterium]